MNFVNWKTSLVGCVGAVLYAVLPLVQGGKVEVKDVLIAAIIAAVSFFAKDRDVTGVGADAIRPVNP